MEKKDKKSIIEALAYVAQTDKAIDEEERAYLYSVGEEFGISETEVDLICEKIESSERKLEDIVAEIDSLEDKNELIMMMVELCHADDNYSGAEKAGMADVCRMLNIDIKILRTIEMERLKKDGKHALKKGFGAVKNGLNFVGEKSIEGGKYVASGIASGIGKTGTKISDALASAKKLREDNKKLRDMLKVDTVTEAVKQKIILQLNAKIIALTAELKREKERNDQNEEIIKLLQAQLEDLERTIEVAEAAKTA